MRLNFDIAHKMNLSSRKDFERKCILILKNLHKKLFVGTRKGSTSSRNTRSLVKTSNLHFEVSFSFPQFSAVTLLSDGSVPRHEVFVLHLNDKIFLTF